MNGHSADTQRSFYYALYFIFCLLHDSSWYQEVSSRSDAQEKLMSQPVGAFLIRGSQNAVPGDFSISVRCIHMCI